MRPYTISAKDYNSWLRQSVWVTNLQKEERRYWIPDFAEDLRVWMKRKGYAMCGAWGGKAVALWLYAIQVQEVARKNYMGPIQYPCPMHRNWPEDKDTYEIQISHKEVEEFLDRWRNVEDLDRSTPSGLRVYCELQNLIYIYLDLDSSKHGIRIARIMEAAQSDTESDSGNGRKLDDYILDVNEGWHSSGKW